MRCPCGTLTGLEPWLNFRTSKSNFSSSLRSFATAIYHWKSILERYTTKKCLWAFKKTTYWKNSFKDIPLNKQPSHHQLNKKNQDINNTKHHAWQFKNLPLNLTSLDKTDYTRHQWQQTSNNTPFFIDGNTSSHCWSLMETLPPIWLPLSSWRTTTVFSSPLGFKVPTCDHSPPLTSIAKGFIYSPFENTLPLWQWKGVLAAQNYTIFSRSPLNTSLLQCTL